MLKPTLAFHSSTVDLATLDGNVNDSSRMVTCTRPSPCVGSKITAYVVGCATTRHDTTRTGQLKW